MGDVVGAGKGAETGTGPGVGLGIHIGAGRQGAGENEGVAFVGERGRGAPPTAGAPGAPPTAPTGVVIHTSTACCCPDTPPGPGTPSGLRSLM